MLYGCLLDIMYILLDTVLKQAIVINLILVTCVNKYLLPVTLFVFVLKVIH